MEIKITCPLGSQCETAKDGFIERCAWYVEMVGTCPNTGDDLKESRCSMAWQPILMIDIAGKTNSVGAAVESFRNETTKGHDAIIAIASQNTKLIG